jgi:spermidine synthase
MKSAAKLNLNKYHLSTISLNFLSGLIISFLAALLIYFKQKEIFHHSLILILVFGIFFSGNAIRNWLTGVSNTCKAGSLILILLICWFGPQFMYQIRPHTFYISGFALGSMLIVAFSTTLLSSVQVIKFHGNYIIFLAGYLLGYFLSPEILQFIIFGLSIIVAINITIIIGLKSAHKALASASFITSVMVFWWYSSPIIYFGEQSDYEDKVLFSTETQYHQLVVTQWHEDYWFFIDQLKNMSSIDEYLYYEPMAHSVFKVKDGLEEILVIGGENGCLLREISKHPRITKIDVISYDTLLRDLGMENQLFIKMNKGAYSSEKVHIIHEEILQYISNPTKKYDAIYIDLPDPRSIETNQYYTIEFYNLVQKLLDDDGIMITQAGSPYYATQAFYSIGQTIEEAGLHALPIHNQILTLGEWGWYICSKKLTLAELKEKLVAQKELGIETSWFNQEAANLIASFGKTYNDTLNVSINSLDNPLVYRYYLKGNWDLNY